MNASTAGKGDPYWYEWTVGLLKVVEMLRPESGIQSVSFQVTGAKGWDDVVVRYAEDRRDFIQIKHSRVGRSITFGDLVSTNDEGTSLLANLFCAWRAMKLKSGSSRCILFTNRAAGEAVGRSEAGVSRPPLLNFIAWLKGELPRVKSARECRPPTEWAGAWKEWLAQLSGGTAAQRIAFLKSFDVHTNQEDLRELETSVLSAISEIFQISATKALPLFQALDSALRRWTTTEEHVTAEDAASAMALDGEVELEHRAPPPPAPFFPSRHTALVEVEAALKAVNGCPILFLCAEPGAGKTSLVSQLANRRVSEAFQGVIGLRYFAFRPITPGSPLIPPDADHFVQPDRLWFNLLSQLRRGLKGKLRAYQVPLRNDLLRWAEARTHVLRIAEQLGREMGHPFVIVIDGIDHAARAMRGESTQAKDFFASLPGPDEIAGKAVRLMLAGQPPECYPEYPSWLRASHPKVQKLSIGQLETSDVLVLLEETKTLIPIGQKDATCRVIKTATNGNTLAVVFAIEEARTCNSIGELQIRLNERRLGDGLEQYYRAIWQHALAQSKHAQAGIEGALATTLCLTPERLTGSLMAPAFQPLGLNSEQWQLLLSSLGPLVVEDADGFRVLHNDVRVFLHGLLATQPLAARRQWASLLADHYLQQSSNRWFAHKSLLRLLRDAGREVEWARVFTVDWVFEASALGIPYAEMSEDCANALRQGLVLRDWNVMQALSCATETLERWEERCDMRRPDHNPELDKSAPAFLHTEAFVRPLAEWEAADLHELVRDAELLVAAGEVERARSLLVRWLTGLSVTDLCRSVNMMEEARHRPAGDEPGMNPGMRQTLESLGAVCRSTGFNIKSRKPKKDIERQAEAYFEAGWVQVSCQLGPFNSLDTCLSTRSLRYLNSYEVALREFASNGHWHLVRKLMADLSKSRDRMNADFKAQAAWWALRSDAASDDPGWIDVLSAPRFGLTERRLENLPAALAICRALGWKDAAIDTSVTAQKVFVALRPDSEGQEVFNHYRLLFRVAATLGRGASLLHRRGVEAAAGILPPAEMAQLTSALWDYHFNGANAHQDRDHARTLAVDLVRAAYQLGDEHQRALLQVAKPVVEKFPVDFRRDSLWELYQRAGDLPLLRAWVRRWLADDGWLWKDDSSSRESIADELLPLARQVGELELIAKAEERLSWLQITYRENKEYTFDTPIAWFRELSRVEPKSWRDLGLKLWKLSEACSALGGDNRCAWQLDETLGAAAWDCGSEDVWQLITVQYPDCGTESWFHPTSNRILDGLVEHLKRKPDWPMHAKLVGWCLAVGFSRWFDDDDIKRLARLRDTLSDTAQSVSERAQIADAIQHLTPGEARRNPRPETSERGTSLKATEKEDLQSWLGRIETGEEIPPTTAVRLLREVLSGRPNEFNTLASKILEAVGVGASYGWVYYSSGSLNALLEIGRLASNELLWKLVSAAIRYAGAGSGWTQGLCRNLHHVLLARAASHGASDLRTGLVRLLHMHERWARGGRSDLELPLFELRPAEPVESSAEMAARSLTFLLASRSAEVIESTLIGIQALVRHEPSVIGQFLKIADGDLWKQHWLLNAAEVWAALFPVQLQGCHVLLQSWLTNGPLHRRVQTWLVLRRLAQCQTAPLPSFPYPTPSVDRGETVVLQSPRQIMETPATKHGAFRFVDLHHAAESTIERVEHATKADLHQVRDAVANELLHATPDNIETEPWPTRIRCYGDTTSSSLQKELILDEAFDDCLHRSPVPLRLQGFFAQAYLNNEDPWILCTTPLPDDDAAAWPTEDEMGGIGQKPPLVSAIRQKLFLLATRHRAAEDELVLAARAQVFSLCEDFIFRLWREEGDNDSTEIHSRACPTTMSGRTFGFGFDKWWEPHIARGTRPMTYAVGGHQRLSLCFPEFMPAEIWRSEFGWEPDPDNPLRWLSDGRPVARYERIHGAPRSTRCGHPRQPLLTRWLVKKAAWEGLAGTRGPFQQRDDFARFRSNIER